MPAVVRLNKQGLAELIDNIKVSGGDTTELDNIMNEINEDENAKRPVKRRQASLQIEVDEATTEERLSVEVGSLFPEGITGELLAEIIDFDRNHTLAEIREMCREAGISASGDKKELAARLIARGVK